MRSSSIGFLQRRIFSATVKAAAVSTFRSSVVFTHFFVAAAAHSGIQNQKQLRLFAENPSSIMGTDNSVLAASLKRDNDKKHTEYEKWVRRLYMTNMFHPVKMGLANMESLHRLLGYPMDDVSEYNPFGSSDVSDFTGSHDSCCVL